MMKEMDNDINKWGLLNSLISIINNREENSAEVSIAKYLLENYERMQDLNIYDVAEECYVDRATIRRMAQNLGFNNFKALKNQFLKFPNIYSFYHSGIDNSALENTMAQQISIMANECEAFFTSDRLDEITQNIYAASQIVFLMSDVYSRQSSEFQKAMILAGKMVRVVSKKYYNNEVLGSLKPNDIVIVVSISGFFVSQILPVIKSCLSKKVLMTTVQETSYDAFFDEIWRISRESRVDVKSVYTIYATQYCLEIISTAYIKKFDSNH